MALCEPTVVGPVSELTVSIRVQGQLAGATVTVLAQGSNPRVVADGTATSADQRFTLTAGEHLRADDLLVAVQKLSSETSQVPTGDLGIAVQPKPSNVNDIGVLGLETHLWQCGQFVYVSGAIPGANVALATTSVIGSGIADEGVARFELTTGLPSSGSVRIYQEDPGVGHGPVLIRNPDPIPANLNHILPPPVMALPLRGCDASIGVSGVFDGAQVTIKDQSGNEATAGFDLSGLQFVQPSPLVAGDELVVRQEFQGECARTFRGKWSSPAALVGPAAPVAPPTVETPLCVGGSQISLTNLRPGAKVHISANGTVYDGSVPDDCTAFTFRIPPLTGGDVTATQELCSVTSEASPKATVDAHPAQVTPATVVGPPLWVCTQRVG